MEEQDLVYGKYQRVKQNFLETYHFHKLNANVSAQKDFEFDQKFVETEVHLPLDKNCSALLLHKMPEVEVKKDHDGHSKQEPNSTSMQWRSNVGVIGGGKYYFEIKIIDKPSIVMLGWSSAKTKIFQDTVFSFGTDPNSYMLDCSAGVLWHDGCTQARVCSAAEVDDIYGSVLDYDEKTISFYHVRRGKRRVLDTARFDVENFPELKSLREAMFPSVGLYCGQVAFYGKSILQDGGITPIAQGYEDKISISLVHSTNVPKSPSLDYYIVTLEWMQKIYVKFFDGTAIPYGADAYKHMTFPFFSIFQPQLFQDEDGNSGAPDPELFNAHPEELWSLFFRAFLFAALFEGFDAYLKERDAIYRRHYLSTNPTTSRNINQIRPRSSLEIRYESAMKCGLLHIQSLDFDDVKENGLYTRNISELTGLFRKCEISLENMDDQGTAVEKALLILWGKILVLFEQNKNGPFPTEEGLEAKLQSSLDIMTNAQAELQARVKGVWESYICHNLPKLDFPHTQTPLKEYVRLSKSSLIYYLDKEPTVFPLPTASPNNVMDQNKSTKESGNEKLKEDLSVTDPIPETILKDGSDKESESLIYVGLALTVLIGGGVYYFMKKKDSS